MDTLRVAALQMNVGADPEANLAQAEDLVGRAAEAGAHLAALPENVLIVGPPDRRAAASQPLEGPAGRRLADLARRHRLHLLVGGFPEASADGGHAYNTCFLLAPDGALRARYRKLHLFDIDLPDGRSIRESSYTRAGDEVVTVDVPLPSPERPLRLGLSVCYDVRFPELYRAQSAAGARVLFVPSAFTVPTGRAHWHLLLRARAVENLAFVVAPAQCGVHGETGRSSYGHSLIVDPWGEIVGERTEDSPGLVVADLDLARQDEVRARLPALEHRRLGAGEPLTPR